MSDRGDDMCVCGHTRAAHNNRIEDNYIYNARYNCCMASLDCGCLKFKKKEGKK